MSVSSNILMHVSHTDSILNSTGMSGTTYIPRPFIQFEELRGAREQTNTSPTQAEIKSDSYRKGGVMWGDRLLIEIENPFGSLRSGVDADGNAWSSKMVWDYGEVHATDGFDGDPVDVFIGPDLQAGTVYIIDQADKEGGFDEHKCMLCFSSEKEAVEGYLANYEKGWDRIMAVTAVGPDEFQHWVNTHANEPASKSFDYDPEVKKVALDSLGINLSRPTL